MAANVFSPKPLTGDPVPQPAAPGTRGPLPMLVPSSAWRILNARTGGAVSRPTFYRWLGNGKIYSVRVGHRMYIPWLVLDELIEQCLAGERIDR
jgi:excisionase family DNA binding protein